MLLPRRVVRAWLVLGLCLSLPTLECATAQEVVRDIVVEGAQRTETSTIQSYLLIQPGDPFDDARIDRSLKSLFATGLFADVSISRNGDQLVVKVVENPIINRVAFEGNERIDDKTLEAEVALRPRTIYTRAKVQSDVTRILTLYRRSGRFAATVEPKVIELPQNRVDVVFEIQEGDVTTVESIKFIGNKEFDDSELRTVIRTKESAWWRFFSTDDTYDPDRLSLDRELLRRFYLRGGYADFRVVSSVAELSPDREGFYLVFTIEEGERYKVGKVDVHTTLKGLDPTQLKDVLKLAPGDWYDADKVEKSIDALSDAVGTLGYAFVDVRPKLERNREAHTIDLAFDINEGPRVFIERIDISGNTRTQDRVIRREFRLVEGDAFDAAKLRRSRQRIQDLDFFEKVNVEQVPGNAPDRAVIKVGVEEKSTGSLSVGAGFSTGTGILGDVSVRERNFLGRGQDVVLSALLGQRRKQAELSFTEPYFLDREVSAGFDGFYIETDRQSESSFDVRTYGGDLRIGYPWSEAFTESWKYTLKSSEMFNVPSSASIFVQEAQGTETYSEISHIAAYDKRDSKIDPTSGYLAKLVTDVAGLGGSVAYMRNRIETDYYYPVAENWVLSLSGNGGIINGLGEDVKLLDRFFIGGNEVRGFKIDGIGPRDRSTNDALGGEYFYAGSVQLAFPLGFPEEFRIKGRVFNDVGSSWKLQENDPNHLIEDSSSLRASAGFGMTWVSPFGPLGVDIGYAYLKENYDRTELFRLNFGTRF
ncbi:outer membrane protein assembly factor BamA [Defluviicoccus vanus]|uniref:Outer membrane protein assembly factor BamA n=1 Tax=Defluviicoccus vanus TaxID=111831 RepID=A0A7H1N6Q7_9PROT|nr:outer membrane protein assembly factor BamA [Defluviicoccus vanus]